MKRAIHPGTDVGCVRLKVADVSRSLAFYREVVGLDLLRRTAATAELGPEGAVHPLVELEEISESVRLPRRKTAGLYHFAILVPDRRTLGRSLRKLAGAGLSVGQADHWVSEALYISDPDNNGIEIYADRPRSEWPRGPDGALRMGVDPLDMAGLLAEAGDGTFDTLPPGTKMGHIHLHVSDLPAAEQFYCGVLGFDRIANFGHSALFVSAGGYHHHLGVNIWAGQGAPPAPAHAVGLAFYTIVLPDRAALEEVLHALRSAGVDCEPSGDDWFARDPSQNRIRFALPR